MTVDNPNIVIFGSGGVIGDWVMRQIQKDRPTWSTYGIDLQRSSNARSTNVLALSTASLKAIGISDVIVVATPYECGVDILTQLESICSSTCVIIDFFSVKTHTASMARNSNRSDRWAGLNPLFRPPSPNHSPPMCFVDYGLSIDAAKLFSSFAECLQCRRVDLTPSEHDQMMAKMGDQKALIE